MPIKVKKILAAHPTGNENTRGAINGFTEKGILHSFHTCVACFDGDWLYKLTRFSPFREFKRRMFARSLQDITFTYPFNELMRILASKIGIHNWVEHEKGRFCVDRIYQDLDMKVAQFVDKHYKEIGAVYLYEDCATEIVKSAKRHGLKFIYDLPIGYWRTMHRLLDDEKNKKPEWSVTLTGLDDSEEKLTRKDAELRNADRIYVASSFTKKTLQEYPDHLADIVVIPYGFPQVNQTRQYTPLCGRKLKVLFVGGLSQRKGISYVFDAIKGLENQVELTVIGQGDIDRCKALRKALQEVNYIPSMPHEEILKFMSESDILLFPSLFEGFGLVITEAMSQGTPVITTDRTCGPDVIRNGRNGWIVEAGNAEPIKEILKDILNNPGKLEVVGKAAMKTASERPWRCYEEELSNSVSNYLNGVLS